MAETFVDLLGHVPHKQIGADLRAASPVTYIAPGDPPFLLMHSTDDEIVYPQQIQEMAWDLAANHVPHKLVMVDGGGHEFDNPGEQPTEAGITKAIVQFFVRHAGVPPAALRHPEQFEHREHRQYQQYERYRQLRRHGDNIHHIRHAAAR